LGQQRSMCRWSTLLLQWPYYKLVCCRHHRLGIQASCSVPQSPCSSSRPSCPAPTPAAHLYLLASVADETLKNVQPHSVATALANMVLPVPGGPNSMTPCQQAGKCTNQLVRVVHGVYRLNVGAFPWPQLRNMTNNWALEGLCVTPNVAQPRHHTIA
jgi:hypothetical protein